jgi:hypothetical protein
MSFFKVPIDQKLQCCVAATLHRTTIQGRGGCTQPYPQAKKSKQPAQQKRTTRGILRNAEACFMSTERRDARAERHNT